MSAEPVAAIEGTVSVAPEWKLGYRPMLTALRGVAILMVLPQHAQIAGFPRTGTVGVTLFFVLSGFLITRLLVEERVREGGRVNLRAFYWRRAVRLLPALFAMVAATALWFVIVGVPEAIAHEMWQPLLYVSDIAMPLGTDLGPMSHTWSLSIEEQFYFLWPSALLLLLGSGVGRKRTVICVALGGAVLSASMRFILWPEMGEATFWAPFTQADGLLLGCCLGLLSRPPHIPRVLVGAAMVSVGITGLIPNDAWVATVGLPLATCGSCLLVAAAANSRRVPWRPIASLGTISYGLYIWHNPIIHSGNISGWPMAGAVTVPLSIAVATLSYRYIELPFLHLKRRPRSERMRTNGGSHERVTREIPLS